MLMFVGCQPLVYSLCINMSSVCGTASQSSTDRNSRLYLYVSGWFGRALPFHALIYAYCSIEFLHFCWRPRSASVQEPVVDLLMMPADGYLVEHAPNNIENHGQKVGAGFHSPTNGRIIVLKFASSSQKYPFWLQSKSQHPSEDPSLFSRRDHEILKIVNRLLDSQEVNVMEELRKVNQSEDETTISDTVSSSTNMGSIKKNEENIYTEQSTDDNMDKAEDKG